ncbi:MAG: hypothetical protein CMB99_13830 [Flavobacteriaceae bacterium]|nr:hypothetical protein [Flavobacteriaceae bacterium]|tara:strand:- start:50462 stop:51280 length:819 start_codon:yes stop_codon:yes gene_type:complete
MNRKIPTLPSLVIFIILFSIQSGFGQSKKLIYGNVRDSVGAVKDVNILNISNKVGTVSNRDGYFRILVRPGDTIQFSSVQHLTQRIKISDFLFKEGNLTIFLLTRTYKLDEFELKRTELVGRLGIDISKVAKDRRDSILRSLMDFSDVDMNAKVADDWIDQKVRPEVVDTDPINQFFTAGAAVYIPFKYSEKLWRLRRDLDYRKSFPYKILVDLGETFFFEELEIPVERYFHFLEYCNPLGIENLYLKKNYLKVIQILRTESKSYLKLLKKE